MQRTIVSAGNMHYHPAPSPTLLADIEVSVDKAYVMSNIVASSPRIMSVKNYIIAHLGEMQKQQVLDGYCYYYFFNFLCFYFCLLIFYKGTNILIITKINKKFKI